MLFVYRIVVVCYGLAVKLAGFFNPKAKLWADGRKNWRKNFKTFTKKNRVVWMHCASLGEFEQGRPILEGLKKENPELQIVLSFFSPSGYEIRKNYALADLVVYLPLDSPGNARDFIALTQPDLVLFVKYEFWYYYLAELKRLTIPCYLVSANIRAKSGIFNRFLKPFYRKIFHFYTHIFVQLPVSLELLQTHFNLSNITVTGDTRFDRVVEIANGFQPIPQIEAFVGGRFCFVCGSTWPKDEELLLKAYHATKNLPICWIFAPHHVDQSHIMPLKNALGDVSVLFSELNLETAFEKRVLIVDNIGMLSRIYHYAGLVWIGGGFGVSIHNTLEAAVYGVKILFGPNFHKFVEAIELQELNAARMITEPTTLMEEMEAAFAKTETYRAQCAMAKRYVAERTGATAKVLAAIDLKK